MTSVRTRILLFFTLFAVASAVAVYTSSRNTVKIGEVASAVVSRQLPIVQALGDMEVAIEQQGTSVVRFLLTGDKRWWDESERAREVYVRAYDDARRAATEQIELDRLRAVDEAYVQFDDQARQVLLTPRGAPQAVAMLRKSDEYLASIRTTLGQMQNVRRGMAIVRQDQVRDALSRSRRVAVGFVAIIILFFLGLAAYLWRALLQPLSLLLEGIRNFTRGKTDVQIPSIGKDELGELQEAFNEMSRELELERKRLKTESQSDSLTGLFNMRYFRLQLVEEFSRSQRYGRPLTLLMLDVDHFKAYNDRNGHPAGDIVLKEVSRILIRNVRGTDVVARYGGEEFVVLLPETPLEAGVSVAEKIRRAVEEHYFPFAGTSVGERLSISIGVASYPDVHVTSDQDLVESSDKALYNAKKNGRNQVSVFQKGETTGVSARERAGSVT